jgi:hypothetical protein
MVKRFLHEAKKLHVTDTLLNETLTYFFEMDLDGRQRHALGAGVYKLRLATNEGQGKSSGSRSILAFQMDHRVIWLHLFAKNDKENITTTELKKLKKLTDILLGLSQSDINRLIKSGELYEVKKHD